MKDYQKYLFKDNINMDCLLEELDIVDKVIFKLENQEKIHRFIKILKTVYKKRKDKELIEPKHYVYIANQSIGWTNTYTLVDQKLDVVDVNKDTSLKYWINLGFIQAIKLDKSTKFVGILVTDDKVVFIANTYCIICRKEDDPMGLDVDTLLRSSKAFNDVQSIKINNSTYDSFKELKTLSQAFKSDIVSLYRVKGLPNSMYYTLNLERLVAYIKSQNCKADRQVNVDQSLIRVAFGTDSLVKVNIDKTNPSLVANYDMNLLDWILESLKDQTLNLRIAIASMVSQLVFDLDDFMILIMPTQVKY